MAFFTPNRSFQVACQANLGESSRFWCILGKFSRAKLLMRRPREPNLPPERTWGPFIESHCHSNLTGPKSDFEIKVSRKVGCVMTSNKVHFVSLADKFIV